MAEAGRRVVKANGIGDAAVRAKTGKGWDEWFAVLDAAGGREMDHRQMVAYLSGQHGVPGWWCQMVTVAYEQERGKRARHQAADGYQVSGNKTVAAPVAALYGAWEDPQIRRRWLPDPDFTIRKATPCKSMRITWVDGRTNVDVNFYARGGAKSQVSLQHSKLANADEVERVRAYWREALDRLKAGLEGGV